MSTLVDIPEGNTNEYLVHGVFAIILGGILLLVSWVFTLLLVVLAVVLFRVRSGIEIDLAGRRVRVYRIIGTGKYGSWIDARPYQGIELRYTNESQVMSSRATSTNVRVRTYDLTFIGVGGEYLFHDFTDHAKARKAAVTMAKEWSMTLRDEVGERRQRGRSFASVRRR